jgi:hypothetical protein
MNGPVLLPLRILHSKSFEFSHVRVYVHNLICVFSLVCTFVLCISSSVSTRIKAIVLLDFGGKELCIDC